MKGIGLYLDYRLIFFFFFFLPSPQFTVIRSSGQELFSPGMEEVFFCMVLFPGCSNKGVVACSEKAVKQSI